MPRAISNQSSFINLTRKSCHWQPCVLWWSREYHPTGYHATKTHEMVFTWILLDIYDDSNFSKNTFHPNLSDWSLTGYFKGNWETESARNSYQHHIILFCSPWDSCSWLLQYVSCLKLSGGFRDRNLLAENCGICDNISTWQVQRVHNLSGVENQIIKQQV